MVESRAGPGEPSRTIGIRNRRVIRAFALLITMALAFVVAPLVLSPIAPAIPKAHATTDTIVLSGCASTIGCPRAGWNGTTTSPNPTITVHQGDTVSLSLSSADGNIHQFLLDGDRDGAADRADCPAVDPCSVEFSTSSTTSYSFNVNLAPGTYTYFCFFHPMSMIGSFVVLPAVAVFVAPSFHAGVVSGATVNFWVNVTGMPLFNSFNVFVRTNDAALHPTSISTAHIIFASPSVTTSCINGAGTGCVMGIDGVGIVHEAVVCTGCSATGSGLLFNITYTAGTTTQTIVDVYNDIIQTGSSTANIAHVTSSGQYGSMTIPDFSISAVPLPPSTLSVPRGRTGLVNVTLLSLNGFSGTLTLNTKSTPADLPVVLNATSVALASGGIRFVQAAISPTSTTGSGAHGLAVNASGGSPLLIHPITVSVTVTIPNFSVTASPSTLFVPVGTTTFSNSSALTLSSLNTFSGKVTVSFTVFPSVLNPPTITLINSTSSGSSLVIPLASGGTASASLNVATTPSTTAATYTVTVTGVSGSLSQRATVSVSVVPFTISANPTSGSVQAGLSTTSTITLHNLAAYLVNVSLTTTVSPAVANGPSATFQGQASGATGVFVVLAPSGTGTAILEVNTTLTTPANIYTVMATGANGTGTRSAQVATTVAVPFISVVPGSDGALYWSQLSGTWSKWASLGGSTSSVPAVCSSGSGHFELVVRGSNNQVYHNSFSGGAWTGWDTAGGLTTDAPSCAVSNGILYVVVRGLDNAIYVNSRSLSTGLWASWLSLGGATPSQPVIVASPSASRLDVVVRGMDNQLYHKFSLGGPWSAWDSAGGITLDIPAAVSDGTGIDIVVRGVPGLIPGNGIWYNRFSFGGSWSGWLFLAGYAPSTPSITIDASGALHVVVRGLDNAIYHIAKASGATWSSTWDNLGGLTPGRPAVSAVASSMVILTRSNSNIIDTNMFTGIAWQGWRTTTGISGTDPSVSPPQ